jgi:myo-inositol-1(or 4)-monophosphatase
MAAVAAGRFDGFWERNLSSWDVAAGIVMIREAGGTVGDIHGGDLLKTGNVVAGNEYIHGELTKILKPLG